MPPTAPSHGRGPLGEAGAHRLCVAPMMDWTDRHFRSLLRLLGPELVLYTEMVTARALIHGDRDRFLAFDPSEHPVALQLGGADPEELARAARFGAEAGYDEINLNCGCPSDRVASGSFGAALMAEPERVAACVAAMRAAVDLPVTVKCRLGIIEGKGPDAERMATRAWFDRFVDTVADAGCSLFVVHARDAVLGGLSPRENREVPPLRHDEVRRLARRRPDLEIVSNGGITSRADCRAAVEGVHGVMIGRAAVNDTLVLAAMRDELFGTRSAPDPVALVRAWLPYVRRELEAGTPLTRMTRLLSGLFHGRPGARLVRRHLSEHAHRGGLEVIEDALALLEQRSRAA